MREKLTKVEFSNLDKIIFPDIKVTKEQIIQYYIKVAPKMLPFLTQRPLVLTRYPDGINKEGFYAKDSPMGIPDWVKTVRFYSESAKRNLNYILCNDLDTLIWLANLAAVEIHIPLSKVDNREAPDFIFFDVDPEPPATFEDGANTALIIRDKLDQLGLKSYIKLSGKKGLHILIPILRNYKFKETRNFVHAIGKILAKESEIIVSEFADTKKPGKVFIDYLQNSKGRTLTSPYSLRATSEATVAIPIEWEALKKKIKPAEFNISTVPNLKENPWKDIFENPQKIEAL